MKPIRIMAASGMLGYGFTEEAFKNGLLLVNASNNVVRFLPPLNISETEIFEAIKKFDETLSNLDI